MSLPPPDCPAGYTDEQLREILQELYPNFQEWMRGQGVAVCNGFVYNHLFGQYEPGCSTKHGVVTFPYDLDRYMRSHPSTQLLKRVTA